VTVSSDESADLGPSPSPNREHSAIGGDARGDSAERLVRDAAKILAHLRANLEVVRRSTGPEERRFADELEQVISQIEAEVEAVKRTR